MAACGFPCVLPRLGLLLTDWSAVSGVFGERLSDIKEPLTWIVVLISPSRIRSI